jgi:hypothetical protein
MARHRVILEEWYRSARISPSASVGYRYPGCTIKMLKLLDHAHEIRHADARHWKPISSNRAAHEFENDLARPPTRAQRECITRLKSAWTDRKWSPDVAIKSFFDLDVVYFGGYLREKLRLRWKGSKVALRKEDAQHGFGQTGFEQTADVPTARIILNAEGCLKDAVSIEEAIRETFGTLLHELIHGKIRLKPEMRTSKANERNSI